MTLAQAADELSPRALLARFAVLIGVSLLVGAATFYLWGLSVQQTVSVSVFLIIILSTLFFWNFPSVLTGFRPPCFDRSGAGSGCAA